MLSESGWLTLERALLALPDLHRLGPYWRALAALRVRAMRARGLEIDATATLHERVHLHRGVAIRMERGAEVRDQVQIGIDEPGLRASSLTIGAGSRILSESHLDCSAPITIGARTLVGRRAQLFTHSHDVDRRDVPVLDAPIISCPVTIGNDVMLYSDVVVLPGVMIGDGAVVAVRSVVTRDVPPYAKMAGSPARQIGERH